MDNISHSLAGIVLARAGFNRWRAGTTLVLLIAANIPDIDIMAASRGALAYLEAHRGYTHSLVGLPFMAALSVLLASALLRRWLFFPRVFAAACVGVASHLFLDWTNSYGIRLLLPFSPRWFHLDWNSLTDYVAAGLFLFGVVWPYFGRLVSGEIGSKGAMGRGVAWLVLALFGILEVSRALLHSQAVAQLNTVFYDDQAALQVAALPAAGNPFVWRTVVETTTAFETGWLSWHSPGPREVETFRKLRRDPAIESARRTQAFRFFEYFSRFPVWSEEPGSTVGPKTTRLDLTDLRFGQPGRGAFHCIALVNAAGQVQTSLFTFQTGDRLGWAADATMRQK